MPRAFPFARSKPPWTPACSGSGRGWPWWRPCCSPTFHGSRHPIGTGGLGLAGGGVRMTPGTNRRLRIFATTQIACSFVLLAGAGMLVATLTALQTANTGYDMRQVLAIDVPPSATGVGGAATLNFFQEATRRIGELPGVQGVAAGMIVPWRDPSARPQVPVCSRGVPARGWRRKPDVSVPARLAWILRSARCPDPRGPRLYGRGPQRHRTRGHRQPERGTAPVPERRRGSTDVCGGRIVETPQPRRIVGIVADVDDENVVQEPSMTVYDPIRANGACPAACSSVPQETPTRSSRP